MRNRTLVAFATTLGAALPLHAAWALQAATTMTAREGRIPLTKGSLYIRDLGQGRPVIVVHGGPDFDHLYLLPDFDRLADSFRLIYYDQRGRGMSAEGVAPEDVTLASDVADLDLVRQHFQLASAVVLGHSWGAVLALEYALRHPTRVSQLILMNPAPASSRDRDALRKAYLEALGADMDRQRAILTSPAYQEGDPETVAARYRIHFEHALARPEDYERLMSTMRAGFVSQGKAGIVKARAVEDRLMHDSWDNASYDLMPKLESLRIPTLVISSDHDFIPREIAQHITDAIPNAKLVVLKNCGHFSYLECPGDVRSALDDFFKGR